MQMMMRKSEDEKNLQKKHEHHEVDHLVLSSIMPTPIVKPVRAKAVQKKTDSHANSVDMELKPNLSPVDVNSMPVDFATDSYIQEQEPMTEDRHAYEDFISGKNEGGIKQKIMADGVPVYSSELQADSDRQKIIDESLHVINQELTEVLTISAINELEVEQKRQAVEIYEQINLDILDSERLVELNADFNLISEHLRICAKELQLEGHLLADSIVNKTGDKELQKEVETDLVVFRDEVQVVEAREFVDRYLVSTEWFEHKAQEFVKSEDLEIREIGIELAEELNKTEQNMIKLEENNGSTYQILKQAREDLKKMIEICYEAEIIKKGEKHREDETNIEPVNLERS
jgi:hypothetical protein